MLLGGLGGGNVAQHNRHHTHHNLASTSRLSSVLQISMPTAVMYVSLHALHAAWHSCLQTSTYQGSTMHTLNRVRGHDSALPCSLSVKP